MLRPAAAAAVLLVALAAPPAAAQQALDWMSLPPAAWCTQDAEPPRLFRPAAAPTPADTSADFDGAGSVYQITQYLAAGGASVQGGGPTGNYLRLVNGGQGQHNVIGFARTRVGAHCTLTLEFDVRVAPGAGSADGFGVLLAHTGRQGVSGTIAVSEEPNAAGSLGVGFDTYQNGPELNNNHISLHFDGQTLATVDATPVLALGNTGGFAHVSIELAATRGGASVTVAIKPPGGPQAILIDSFTIPNLTPYEARLMIGARTGGESSVQDFDNIRLGYAGCSSEVGAWEPVQPFPIVAIHASLLPGGKIITWDRDDAFPASPYLFDPAGGSITPAAGESVDRFCSGHVLLGDGRLLVAGGHDRFDGFGLASATIYDASTNAWSPIAAPMNAGRWYPTATTLADGNVLVVSGRATPSVINAVPQVLDPELGTWRDLTTANVPQDLYPMMLLGPDGRVFNPGPQPVTSRLDTSGSGAWTFLANTASNVYRGYGSAVLLGSRVLLIGGGAPERSTEIIDLAAASPAWSLAGDMHFARRQLNATILPDGSVFVSGGTSSGGFNSAAGAVYAGEVFDPATAQWRQTAAAQEERIYHTTALLLPDGRVFTAGSGHPSGGEGDHFNYQIYSPAYLFRGARPLITALSNAAFTPASKVTINTPDAARVAQVTLIRLGSVTHAFDQNQRFRSLAFTQVAGGVKATLPANNRDAPPGHYMLFLVDGDGVPSAARIVQFNEPIAVIGGCGIGPELALLVPVLWLARRRRTSGERVELA